MKKIFVSIIVALACSGIPSFSFASDVDGIEIVEYGIYKAELIRVEIKDNGGAGTVSDSKNYSLVKQTVKIPVTINTRFGFFYIVKGRPKGESINLTIRVLYPGIKNPKDNKIYYSEDFNLQAEILQKTYFGWHFYSEWELVPGEWNFQLFYKNRKLAEKKFYVTKP